MTVTTTPAILPTTPTILPTTPAQVMVDVVLSGNDTYHAYFDGSLVEASRDSAALPVYLEVTFFLAMQSVLGSRELYNDTIDSHNVTGNVHGNSLNTTGNEHGNLPSTNDFAGHMATPFKAGMYHGSLSITITNDTATIPCDVTGMLEWLIDYYMGHATIDTIPRGMSLPFNNNEDGENNYDINTNDDSRTKDNNKTNDDNKTNDNSRTNDDNRRNKHNDTTTSPRRYDASHMEFMADTDVNAMPAHLTRAPLVLWPKEPRALYLVGASPLTPSDHLSVDIQRLRDVVEEATKKQPVKPKGYCDSEAWMAWRGRFLVPLLMVVVTVCLLGIVSNVFVIVIYTRKNMVSPINVLFTALAISDLSFIVLGITVAFMWAFFQRYKTTLGWAVYTIFSSCTMSVIQANILMVSLTLAVWRYIAIRHPLKVSRLCSMKNTKRAIFVNFLVCTVLNLPYFLNRTITERDGKYATTKTEMAEAYNKFLFKLSFWLNLVCLRWLPLLAIGTLTIALVVELVRAAKKRKVLVQNTQENKGSTDRTTVMLLIVLVVLLLTLGPHAVLNLIGGVWEEQFGKCRWHLSSVTYLFVLFNSSVNFAVYMIMSKQFRETFMKIFGCKSCFSPETRESITNRLKTVSTHIQTSQPIRGIAKSIEKMTKRKLTPEVKVELPIVRPKVTLPQRPHSYDLRDQPDDLAANQCVPLSYKSKSSFF